MKKRRGRVKVQQERIRKMKRNIKEENEKKKKEERRRGKKKEIKGKG